jgi:hypothetical protein
MLKNIFIGLCVITFLVVVLYDYVPQGRVYDCTLAEISPDYPIEVKQECRRLLKEYNSKENLLQT